MERMLQHEVRIAEENREYYIIRGRKLFGLGMIAGIVLCFLIDIVLGPAFFGLVDFIAHGNQLEMTIGWIGLACFIAAVVLTSRLGYYLMERKVE